MTTRLQARVVTSGEILPQFSAPDGIRFAASRTLDATYGGAAVNVAMSLARSGIPAARAGALPCNDLDEARIHDAFQALFGSVLERDAVTAAVMRSLDRVLDAARDGTTCGFRSRRALARSHATGR